MPDDPEGTRVSEAVPAQLYAVPSPTPAAVPFRPRERMRKRGVKVLNDTELLALIISDFKGVVSGRLVRKAGLRGLDALTVTAMQELAGLSLAQAQRIVAAFELHRRVHAREYLERVRLVRPADVAVQVSDIKRLRKEHLIGLYLDAQNGLIHRETLSVGSLNTTRTHPREILYPGIVHSALGFILAHNHPSGCPDPSQEDMEFTKSVQRAGELMGIELYDHIIVAETGYVSLRERGLL